MKNTILMLDMLITWVMFGDMVAEALRPQAVTGGGGRDAGRGYLREEEEHEHGFREEVEDELGEDDFWMGIKMRERKRMRKRMRERRRKDLVVSCKRAVPSPATSTSTCR